MKIMPANISLSGGGGGGMGVGWGVSTYLLSPRKFEKLHPPPLERQGGLNKKREN